MDEVERAVARRLLYWLVGLCLGVGLALPIAALLK